MKIAVVDDQTSEISFLCSIIESYAEDTGLSLEISRFQSGEELLSGYQPYTYYVIFLDIYMKNMSGIDTARLIRDKDKETSIVFLTSSRDHMKDAFDLHAFQYLDKAEETLEDSVHRLLDELFKELADPSPYLSFAAGREEKHVYYKDIVYVKSSNHNVDILDSAHHSYSPRMTYSSVYDILISDGRFLQINRGILVNMDKIKDFASMADSRQFTCVLDGDITLPVSINDRKAIVERWQNYIFYKIHSDMKKRRSL